MWSSFRETQRKKLLFFSPPTTRIDSNKVVGTEEDRGAGAGGGKHRSSSEAARSSGPSSSLSDSSRTSGNTLENDTCVEASTSEMRRDALFSEFRRGLPPTRRMKDCPLRLLGSVGRRSSGFRRESELARTRAAAGRMGRAIIIVAPGSAGNRDGAGFGRLPTTVTFLDGEYDVLVQVAEKPLGLSWVCGVVVVVVVLLLWLLPSVRGVVLSSV